MFKVRLCLNEFGATLEQYINNEWRGCSPIYKPENHGGIDNLKNKLALALHGQAEFIPPDDYSDNGVTVTVV